MGVVWGLVGVEAGLVGVEVLPVWVVWAGEVMGGAGGGIEVLDSRRLGVATLVLGDPAPGVELAVPLVLCRGDECAGEGSGTALAGTNSGLEGPVLTGGTRLVLVSVSSSSSPGKNILTVLLGALLVWGLIDMGEVAMGFGAGGSW